MLDFGQGWRQFVKWMMVAVAFLSIVLLTNQHLQHVLGILPYLLLLACPLMHLLGHGHGHHPAGHDKPSPSMKETPDHG